MGLDPTPTTAQIAELSGYSEGTVRRHLSKLYQADLLHSTASNGGRLLKPGAAFENLTDPAHSRASARALARPARGPITRDLDSPKGSPVSHLRAVATEPSQTAKPQDLAPLTKTCAVPDCGRSVGMNGRQLMRYCRGHSSGDWRGLRPEDPRSPFSPRFQPVHRQSKPVQKGTVGDHPDDSDANESEPDWSQMTPGEEWAIRQAQASKPPPQPAAPDLDDPDDDTPVAVPQFVKDQLAELKRMAPSSHSYRRRTKPVEDLDEPDPDEPHETPPPEPWPSQRRFSDPILHQQPPPPESSPRRFNDPILHKPPEDLDDPDDGHVLSD